MMLRGARGRTTVAKRALQQQHYFTYGTNTGKNNLRNKQTPSLPSNNNAAICFTGQGSQYPGMGLNVYKNNNAAKRIVDEADAALGFKISDIMFNTNATKLTTTSIAQPAILLHSIMMLEVVKDAYQCKNVKDAGYQIALGHSLGEYTALVATEAITLSEGIQLVHKRGLAMERAMESIVDTNENQYGMYALMPTTYENAFDLCETINSNSDNNTICNIANHNGIRQVVISGHMSAIDEVISIGKGKKQIRRATKLDVSAPFHSHYMKPAINELGEALDNIHFNDPIIPIVSNVTGEIYHTSDNVKSNLLDQLYSTVQWCKNMDVCGELPNVNSFHEYGPTPILTPLLKSHFQKHDDINSFKSFCTIDDLKFIDDLNVVVNEPVRPIEKVKNLIEKYKEEDAENERLLLRSIAEQNNSDNTNTSGNTYNGAFGADYDSDIDKIYRLREEKEKKQLDSVQLMPQVAHNTVMRAMVGNSIITLLKFLTYLRTGSPAMLSETIHTLVDTGNQAILLVGLREASKGSDERHPYGYGRNAFFWALVSALGLFWAGGGVTVYHGIGELLNPPEHLDVGWETWSILALSFGIDGWVLWKTIQDLLRTKPNHISFSDYIRKITDPFIMAVLLEDSAACAGVLMAVSGIGMTNWTGNVNWDIAASISIGGLLGCVAIYLVRLNQRLLLGLSVDDEIEDDINNMLMSRPSIETVHSVQSQWVGPSAFNYKAEVDFDGTYLAAQLHRNYEPMFVETQTLQADLPLLLSWYAEDVTRLVEKEVKSSERMIRNKYPQAAHIELEPDSKDKHLPAYTTAGEQKEREAIRRAMLDVQRLLSKIGDSKHGDDDDKN